MAFEGANEIIAQLQQLEEKKKVLIEEAKRINRRLHYKEVELKAILPFVKSTEGVRTGPVRATLRKLEFKISTQAFTPKKEREILKEVKGLEKDLEQVLKIEKARRKKDLVEKDIKELTARRDEVDKELSDLRQGISDLREKMKETRKKHVSVSAEPPREREPREYGNAPSPIAQAPPEESYFSLEEIVEIKKKNKKE